MRPRLIAVDDPRGALAHLDQQIASMRPRLIAVDDFSQMFALQRELELQ